MALDDDDETTELSSGSLVRVRWVDLDEKRIYINRFPSGFGWLWNPKLVNAEKGEVYYVPEDQTVEEIVQLPEERWPKEGGTIAPVLAVSDDGAAAILEINGQLRPIPQRTANPFKLGQTVYVDEDGEPGSVITSKPIDRYRPSGGFSELDPSAMLVAPTGTDVQLADFGGSEALVRRALDLVRVALDPARLLERLGVKPVKGILFSGPSGTGKTHLARAISREVNANFYLIDGPEIINKWVGESEQRLRELFDHASANAPAILFFDELDSIVSKRGDDAPEYVTRFVGQFLTALDGFDSGSGLLVIAATNLPGALDGALLRPGRLSYKIEFDGHPDRQSRRAILSASARRVRGAHHADMEALSDATEGWTAAELSMIWTEAGVLAALDRRDQLNAEDIREGALRAGHNRETTRRQEGRAS
ncbi:MULTISPECIES: ATP-binding protein [Dietzia]|uniref:ATP-binding protein n=1 Tax=Dietzia maris TaxID=37915 RepID=A0ABT8H565_9ACTN|nr:MULTISPECIES: ATP-binding protein [Dietzia]MDN4507605.1 ATP-binding protein [Dietzia maris]